ncbi:actin cytoskeleton-regulatory complex protein pan1 [Plakobranchus ocellatus]|uniref:Actin cytoskeleton-regulatory complex protein pan1 n=1 Tax=Plakobranchus ocellatus TaxID=259542 RepID=A0AAV4BL57_9GAST|nr:actin cytoskeleton-regulatory complex protein pan1 [Plakobranchus ocellatus]
MCEKFCASIRAYVSAVKAELRTHTGENAAQIFEGAIDFLSQDFPDPTSIDGQSKEEEGGDGNELKSLKNRISQVEKQLEEAQNDRLTLESVLESVKQEATNVRLTLKSVLESFRQEAQNDRQEAQNDRQEAQKDRQEAQKDRQEAQKDRQEAQNDRQKAQNERLIIKSELESLKKKTQNARLTLKSELESLKKETQNDRQEAQNERLTLKSELGSLKKEAQNIRQEAQSERLTLKSQLDSVRREAQNNRSSLQSLESSMTKNVQRLDAKLETLATETKVSIKEAAAAVTPPPTASRRLKDVRQRKTFTAKLGEDEDEPWILDVQLLPGGRLLLADCQNDCLKLFDTQGQHLHTLECRRQPYCLAVLESSSIRHAVAVTLPFCSGVDLLEVAGDNMKVKRTLQTSRGYVAVAAIDNQTLAVGYIWPNPGIDLIDLGGQVLRQICSSVYPRYMTITEDGDLVCSTKDNKIARVQVATGRVAFNNSG